MLQCSSKKSVFEVKPFNIDSILHISLYLQPFGQLTALSEGVRVTQGDPDGSSQRFTNVFKGSSSHLHHFSNSSIFSEVKCSSKVWKSINSVVYSLPYFVIHIWNKTISVAFPSYFHFNSMFLLIFLIQTGIVATLVGKTSFSPLVWPQCPVFIRKMGKNIEFQWKKMENQLRWLFHMWITYKVRNILQSKYHFVLSTFIQRLDMTNRT